MPDIIQIACPKCKAVFDIPPEYAGQVGECSECDTTFMIPAIEPEKTHTPVMKIQSPPSPMTEEPTQDFEEYPQEAPPQDDQENFTDTDTNPIDEAVPEGEVHECGTETRTVKLSRSNIGMVPELQDDFKLENKPMTSSTSKSMKPQIPSSSIAGVKSKMAAEMGKSQLKSKISSASSASIKSDFPLKKKKAWWMFWR
ncbi:MAG: hypothetical protein A2017_12065 [Lentisphaerae bacterium GWF2_44_16]|nr:MAG: hypothetical protein A2017_12065 [Lentisphaerae bacterium GWF2_44_16]